MQTLTDRQSPKTCSACATASQIKRVSFKRLRYTCTGRFVRTFNFHLNFTCTTINYRLPAINCYLQTPRHIPRLSLFRHCCDLDYNVYIISQNTAVLVVLKGIWSYSSFSFLQTGHFLYKCQRARLSTAFVAF